MPHHTPLISTIVVGLVLAFVFGAVAQRLRISPLVGYLLAGVAVWPFTPGYVADQTLANQLAEIGVILFAVLFFVIGKSLAAFAIVRVFGHPAATALTISASLAQIGEFSFILAGLGVSLQMLPEAGRDLILAGALLSIVLNPLSFAALDWILARRGEHDSAGSKAAAKPKHPVREPIAPTTLTGHVVLVGHGRVGSVVSAALRQASIPALVIKLEPDRVARIRAEGLAASPAMPPTQRSHRPPVSPRPAA